MYFAVELADKSLEVVKCSGETRTTAWVDLTGFPASAWHICGPFKSKGAAYRAIGKREDERDADMAEAVEAAGVPA